jgi:predicted lipoprotein with Yx(FWY)xxD motif
MRRMRTLGLFVVVLLVVAACGTEGGDGTTTVATDTPDVATTADAGQEEPTTTAAGGSATTMAPMADGVHAVETELGNILVDPDGFTLYVFTQDTEGESVCNDSCAESWPPVPADTPIGPDLDGSIFGAVTRADGSEQLTVNGMPLYLFASDEAPGDINGQGVYDVWFVVDADGNMLEAAAGSTGDDGQDVGYDYDY